MDMYVFFSASPTGQVDFTSESFPSLEWKDLTYGDWKINDFKDVQLDVPTSVQQNASLWADIFLTAGQTSPNPADPMYNASLVAHHRKRTFPSLPLNPHLEYEQCMFVAFIPL